MSIKENKRACPNTLRERVYMDHAATTPVDLRVKKAMENYWSKNFGNPSALYEEGREARQTLGNARSEIAKIIGAKSEEIIFTSGGTESDNLAIFGVAKDALPKSGVGKPHIITTKFEHHAVLEPCRILEKAGANITYLKVGKDGIVNPKDVEAALAPSSSSGQAETVLVSIMYANNEIGTIQPIAEIAKVIRNFRKRLNPKPHTPYPLFHTDACQASGYLDLNVEKLGVDLMTINGSKMYGPKGIGLLYARRGIKLTPLMYGGGQESKIRPGTENIPAIVGLAEALKIADKEKVKESQRLIKLRDYFIDRLLKEIPQTFLNGHPEERLPNNINISILGVEGESVVLYLDEAGISCATGSACTSESLEPSHVIMALGKKPAYGHGSLRFTLGKTTTEKDIDYVMNVLPKVVEKLRSISAINIKTKF